MKKNVLKEVLFGAAWKKFLLAMKFTVWLLFTGLVNVTASVYSQSTKLTLDLKDASVFEVLDQIEAQSDFVFIYKNEVGDMLKKVSIKAKELPVEKILDKLFKDSKIKYEIFDKQIILTPDRSIPLKPADRIEKSNDQEKKGITGTVKDENGAPLWGVTVAIKGTIKGTITDADGYYSLFDVADDAVLAFSFIGLKTQEIQIAGRSIIDVQLAAESVGIEDVVVVGYGIQKKESLVGSIATTKADVLERRGGAVNLANALSGQLPGVTVMSTTDEPGKEDPLILIRGQSTWNDASPLILVDGIERRMNDIDVKEVESISVLKDASATAVFGVKGANGVILITTKRGEIGKAKLSVSGSNTFKYLSKASNMMEAYSAQLWKDAGIENEVSVNEASWPYYIPYEEVLKSKKPQSDPYLYPNIDWQDVMLKNFATNQKVNLDVSGGTKVARYFASIGYTHEGDILKSHYNELKGYDPSFSYDRINFRGNLDFDISTSTKLSVNLSGYTGMKKETQAYSNAWILSSIYSLATDAFPPQYEDGMYGHDPANLDTWNPLAILNETGILRTNRMFVGSDFKLDQKLNFITKGLSAQASLSVDNYFSSTGPNIRDGQGGGQYLRKFVDPSIQYAQTAADSASAIIYNEVAGATHVNDYDWILRPWVYSPESAQTASLRRAIFYQLTLNYARSFGNHNVSGLALFSRRKDAIGANFPSYQEDWVSRITYNYKEKYFFEANGAYNGSEKFGPGYRFGFFPSIAVGWMVSNENFMDYDWLDKLKIRGSIGEVGSDAGIPRWGYLNSWQNGKTGKLLYGSMAQAYFGNDNGRFYVWDTKDLYSAYPAFNEGTIANPDINWETVLKRNIGLEVSVLKSILSLDLDLFKDKRSNIFMSAAQRNVPVYFGAPAVAANLGETETKGVELGITFRNKLHNGLEYWVKIDMSRVKDQVLKAEDPLLMPDYMKTTGFAIGQTKSQIHTDIGDSWDDVYAQTTIDNTTYKLPGDWDIVDFNGDGLISVLDNVPYGYPDNRPQNTYSTFLGLDYKNFSFMVQFYGVTNITQYVTYTTPGLVRESAVTDFLADYWSFDNPNATYNAPRVGTTSPYGDSHLFDGSYLRLKTAEVAYLMPSKLVNRVGLASMKLYINGNNLFYWSKLPVDDETGSFNASSYPKLRYINIGFDITF